MNDAIPRPQAKTRKALTPLLEIRNLTKSYDGQHAVDDVSLTIYKGEIFALLGASGCGKSTLLRLISGLIPMDDGSLTLDETGAGETADTTADGQDAVPETVENNDAPVDDTAPAEQPAA